MGDSEPVSTTVQQGASSSSDYAILVDVACYDSRLFDSSRVLHFVCFVLVTDLLVWLTGLLL